MTELAGRDISEKPELLHQTQICAVYRSLLVTLMCWSVKARWVAEFTFELENARARKLDALIAQLKGAVGQILVPDFRRLVQKPVTLSMDAYADEIGLTFFDDRYDFDDDTNEDGFLTVEESPPLGAEKRTIWKRL